MSVATDNAARLAGLVRDADSVVADDEGGGRAATALLIDSGCRHIGFIGDRLALPTIAGRYRGYLAAHAAAGLRPEPGLVVAGVRTTDEACTAVAALLRTEVPVDGFFARQPAIISSKRAGIEACRCEAGFTFEESTRLQTPCNDSASNGPLPVAISYSTAPSEKISERASCGRPIICSGHQ